MAGLRFARPPEKKTGYAQFGIPAYWIVVPDPDQPSMTA
jgi:Uma2 family endonuclease